MNLSNLLLEFLGFLGCNSQSYNSDHSPGNINEQVKVTNAHPRWVYLNMTSLHQQIKKCTGTRKRTLWFDIGANEGLKTKYTALLQLPWTEGTVWMARENILLRGKPLVRQAHKR